MKTPEEVEQILDEAIQKAKAAGLVIKAGRWGGIVIDHKWESDALLYRAHPDFPPCVCALGALLATSDLSKFTNYDRVFLAAEILDVTRHEVSAVMGGFDDCWSGRNDHPFCSVGERLRRKYT